MIRILKDCFDKHGNRYKVISFSGGLYQCQSYSTGKSSYFEVNEISSTPPVINNRVSFADIIKEAPKEEKTKVEEVVASVSEPKYDEPENVEPSYEEEPKFDFETEEIEKNVISKDNVKETAGDFYADF